MDKTNTTARDAREKRGPIEKIRTELVEAIQKRRESRLAPLLDLGTFLIALLFARCHAIFGAHPFAIALISVMPSRVWIAALGSAAGALTLGRAGLIYAMISAIVVFLRIIVSGTDKRDVQKRATFSENLALRASSALIGGFIAAVYESLLSGLSQATVLFGVTMVLLPPVITVALAGFFDTGSRVFPKLMSDMPILSLKGKADSERLSLIFFQGSALVFSFLISLSLAEYTVFGINSSYIFASILTLCVGRRFGALRAAAVGFTSTLGLSSLYSVAFSLAGLVSGVLFPVGIPYALVAGGMALSAWCAYAGGVVGFLSAFPEYSIAALAATPILRRLSCELSEEKLEENTVGATDMLGTMALSYKNKYSGRTEALESALFALSVIVGKQKERDGRPTREEYSGLLDQCMQKYCDLCSDGAICGTGTPLDDKLKDGCIDKLISGATLTAYDVASDDTRCTRCEELAKTVNRAAAILAEDKYRSYKKESTPDTLSLISRLIAEARAYDTTERSTNDALTDKLTMSLEEAEIFNGAARVFGEARPYFIVACEDATGEKISSPALTNLLESISGVRIEAPELYRKGKMVLMAAGARHKLKASFGVAGRVGARDTVSGDVARSVVSEDGRYYALLSDGMGSGAEARDTAEFVSDLLLRALEFSPSYEVLLKLTNRLVRERQEECSATVDLFSLDLVLGNASFIKSGAAPSYIKRGSSLFRIKSRTAPLGLMKDVDAEKIRVEVSAGDYVIMLSDGVSQNIEDAPWLIDMLSRTPKGSPEDYAKWILEGAIRECKPTDDMTVLVTRIEKAE